MYSFLPIVNFGLRFAIGISKESRRKGVQEPVWRPWRAAYVTPTHSFKQIDSLSLLAHVSYH